MLFREISIGKASLVAQKARDATSSTIIGLPSPNTMALGACPVLPWKSKSKTKVNPSTYVVRSRDLPYEMITNDWKFLVSHQHLYPIPATFQHTIMISCLTLGMSEKKNKAKTPATPPKAPNVTPLCPSIISLMLLSNYDLLLRAVVSVRQAMVGVLRFGEGSNIQFRRALDRKSHYIWLELVPIPTISMYPIPQFWQLPL